ncbi:MAG: hypothetical protein QHJ73_08405, partial [Armatimonadota bacterium]|nr:hypothetical protein [Armatimonadota bacterium]
GSLALVRTEADMVCRRGVGLIVADIPFLAGEVGARAGVPCVALGNFTWDWIYEPFTQALPEYAGALERTRLAYRRMQAWLRLPFHHASTLFPEVVDLPLLGRAAARPQEEAGDALGLSRHDGRPRVLVAMRGGVAWDALRRAAEASPEVLFLVPEPTPSPGLANVWSVAPDGAVGFTDLLAACDAVVSKPGYGIVADCAVNGTALLWPPRENFREDEIFRAEAARYLRARELPAADYHAGRWKGHLHALLADPSPQPSWENKGAEAAVSIIERYLG